MIVLLFLLLFVIALVLVLFLVAHHRMGWEWSNLDELVFTG